MAETVPRKYDLRTGPGAKYRFERRLGSGSFGEVFLGRDVETDEPVAIKLETIDKVKQVLFHEAKLCRSLAGSDGFPNLHWYGSEGNYNVMVMDLLGPSLSDHLRACQGKFSLKTVLMLADQMISRIEHLHQKDYIHGDISPDNFVMGVGKQARQVHMIDFGLSKLYRDPKTQKHIPFKDINRPRSGTKRYASVNTDLGYDPTCRDDLEAFGYVLIYFLRGDLPWQGITAEDEGEKHYKIMRQKVNISVQKLCRGFPDEFVTYLDYCRKLKFEAIPDYAYLRSLFRDLFFREGYQYDDVFDWEVRDRNSDQSGTAPSRYAKAFKILDRSDTASYGKVEANEMQHVDSLRLTLLSSRHRTNPEAQKKCERNVSFRHRLSVHCV